MRVFKVTVSYDGTDFGGFQRQTNARSVQQVLEEALKPIEGGDVLVRGAGRTDSGVHALAQVAAFELSSEISAADLVQALNANLNIAGAHDVRVLSVEEIPGGFNPQFSARGKLYRYRIVNAEVMSPFERRFAWHVPRPLDLDAMQEAATAVVGEHDFAAFQAAGGTVRSTVRMVRISEWSETPIETGGRLLTYEIMGSGFLKYMVRSLVGTFVDVGSGRRPASSVAELLASGDRKRAGPTAPPHGLYLVRVDYDTAAPVSFL